MRDLFEEGFSGGPIDPVEAARRTVRPQLRRRFYREVGIAEEGRAWSLQLDRRPVRTPARQALAAPSRLLAEALAAEWQAQTDVIDPAAMPLTRLANSIIDGVAAAPEAVAAEAEKYLATDLVLYRATEPKRLKARQEQVWDPIVDWARHELGAPFVTAQGFAYVEQPEDALAAARSKVPRDAANVSDLWQLGALHSVTTLTGSALIALATLAGRLTVEDAWAAAHVDEDWNVGQWGQDELALQRRAYRFAEMQAACLVLRGA